jgi:hypothetical protein
LEVFLDQARFANQIRNVMFDKFDKTREHLNLLLELVGEFPLFLVAPRSLQSRQLPIERGYALLHVRIELVQTLRESPQFFRIDDGLWHEKPSGPLGIGDRKQLPADWIKGD